MPLFSYLILDALSCSAIVLLRKMAGCFTLISSGDLCPFLMCHGSVAVCDCDISWSYSLVEAFVCLKSR